MESWNSSAGNGDRITVFSPACVVNFGSPVELGTNLVNARSDGEGISTSLAHGQGGAAADPPNRLRVGAVRRGGLRPFQPRRQRADPQRPRDIRFQQELRLNINIGAQYNADPGALYATAGAGVSWNFVKQWSVISEVFALIGPGATNPRFQSGIRYSPTKDVDWDVIYGRNLTGEGANWITLALTFRIGEN